jgi:hypothetical protein
MVSPSTMIGTAATACSGVAASGYVDPSAHRVHEA